MLSRSLGSWVLGWLVLGWLVLGVRRRLLGVLAALILLGCVVVIVLDGQGVFGQIPAPGPWPVEAPAPAGGYGEIR